MISYDEALGKILNTCSQIDRVEEVSLTKATGRILAQAILADRNYPPFNRSAMDGYAVQSVDLEQGLREFTILGSIHAGNGFEEVVERGDAVKIMTGAAVPKGLDVVIRVEDTVELDGKVQLNISSFKVGQNIALEGEDLRKGKKVLAEGEKLNVAHVSTLASLGYATLKVKSNPKVVVVSTGKEVVPVEEQPKDFEIRDSNTPVLTAFFNSCGIDVEVISDIEDSAEAFQNALSKVEADILVTTGAVSMGDLDYVPEGLQALGYEKVFHKVKIKPGKPLWFGKKGKQVVFGLPGNPFSSMVAFKIFIEPYLEKLLDCKNSNQEVLLEDEVKLKNDFDHFRPFYFKKGKVQLAKFNGSGDITAAVGTAGVVRLSNRNSNKKKQAFYW